MMIDPKMLYFGCLALGLVAVGIIWRMQLLTIPSSKEESGIALMSPLIGFLLFLSTCAYVPLWTKQLMYYFDTHGVSSFSPQELESWPQIAALVVSAILLVGFSFIHSEQMQMRIWSQKPGLKAAFLSFLKGALYCVLCYPIVMAIVQTIHVGLETWGYDVGQQQVSLVQLKSLVSYPLLFWTMAVSAVTIVPLIEELLFRGLLQNFFQGIFGPKAAIVIASFIFAAFHFAMQQGMTNIELMVGLFFYAVFMGIFYVRTRTLWVPIGMHATFNAISIFLMMYVV